MKNQITNFALSILLIGLYSCSKTKDYSENLPEVKIISATPQFDGTVLVEAELISEGEAPLEYAGFCCSATSTPEMLDRQVVTGLVDNKLGAFYVQLSEDSTYQFRAWATNEYGYSYSNTLTVDNLVFPIVDPPCTLTMEYLNTGLSAGTGTMGGPHNVSWSNSFSAYHISGSILFASVNIYFDSPLTQGFYTTTSGPQPGYREMLVTFVQGQSYTLKPGTTVYVKTITPGVFDLTICDAPFLFNGTTWLNFNTRLTAIN